MATSGWLMIGVVDQPAHRAERRDGDRRAGELLTGGAAVAGGAGDPADLAGEVPQPASIGVVDDGHHQPVGCLGGDADVDRIEDRQRPRLGVEVGVEAGLLAAGDHDRPDEERQDRQTCAARMVAPVQLGAQRLEVGGVDRVDVGDVRDLGPRRREPLGDPLAQPPQHLGLRLARRGVSRRRAARSRIRRGSRSRSACTTRPSGPDPAIDARSIPSRPRPRPNRRRRRRPTAAPGSGDERTVRGRSVADALRWHRAR